MPGHPPRFFADSTYGGRQPALAAARTWRDRNWDGTDLSRKLSNKDKAAIRRSKEHYTVLAERHNISPNYVHQIRRGDA